MLVLALTVLISIIPLSLILPMLPFLGQELGADPFEVSLIFALYPIMTLFTAPLWGRLSDVIGRKPALVMSLCGTAASFLFFAAADTLLMTYIARALQGLAAGALPITFAMVADQVPPAERAPAIGKIGGALGLGFMIGPVVGGAFLGTDPAAFTHVPASLFGAAAALGAALMAAFLLKETRRAEADQTGTPSTRAADLKAALLVPIFWLLCLQFLISGLMQGSTNLAYALWAGTSEAWGPRAVSFGLGGLGLGFIIANGFLIRPLTRHFGDDRALLIGTLVDAAGLGWFVLGNLLGLNPYLSYAGLILSITGQGIWSTVLLGVISGRTDDRFQGTILGVANGAGMLGRVIGPILAGWLLDEVDPMAPFVMAFVLVLVVASQALRYCLRPPSTQPSSPKPETPASPGGAVG